MIGSELLVRIAGFTIRLESVDGLQLLLEEGYEPFVLNNCLEKPEMVVKVHNGLNNATDLSTAVLYEAQTNEGLLWSVSNSGDLLLFRVFDPDSPDRLQQVAVTDSSFRRWDVYMDAIEHNGATVLVPLKYPLGPLLMYHLTVQGESIMIHCSATSDKGFGRLFTGVSGKGKSTMARLWFEAGASVLNDDRIIIRKVGNGKYEMHNTPMLYEDEPRVAPLFSAYVIHHAQQNEVRELRGAEAVSALAANCIQHGYDRGTLSRHLQFLTEMVRTVSVHSLGFVPTPSVVDFIRNNER